MEVNNQVLQVKKNGAGLFEIDQWGGIEIFHLLLHLLENYVCTEGKKGDGEGVTNRGIDIHFATHRLR